MDTYKILPSSYKNYLKDDCVDIISSLNHQWNETRHDWVFVPNELLLTKEGKDFFEEKIVTVFRVPPNHTGFIHSDNSGHAFNFIIKGIGKMQWFDVNSLTFWQTIKKTGSDIVGPTLYKSDSPLVIDETSESLIKVNPRIPHRIVNENNSERICISIRPIKSINCQN